MGKNSGITLLSASQSKNYILNLLNKSNIKSQSCDNSRASSPKKLNKKSLDQKYFQQSVKSELTK